MKRNGKLLDKNNAFGAPKKTVRALIAMTLVGTLCTAALLELKDAFISISPFAAAAITFYYHNRND